MINPDLDIDSLANAYKLDKRLVIKNFLKPEVAERVRTACQSSVPFSVHYVIDDKYQSKSPVEVNKMSAREKQTIYDRVSASASQGVGFLYDGYLRSRAEKTSATTDVKELDFLHSVFDYIDSENVINIIKSITGKQDITAADSQFTRFTSGHFLTRHLDVVPGKGRRIAFVLGLTKNWHPDWGGLLQFYEKNGTPRDAWMPQFNVLSIFEVSHIHAVTYIAPYATEPRLSLTGWFVAKA
ncbi:MAG: 2OG-Fe(II) oxygenase [Xanthomonadales bacterium]|nr:2OG-Fe(II) oxygenase [Xanthomonadales bacterium]